MLPEVIDRLLNIIYSSLLLGYVSKTFKLKKLNLILQANLESTFSVKDIRKICILC